MFFDAAVDVEGGVEIEEEEEEEDAAEERSLFAESL